MEKAKNQIINKLQQVKFIKHPVFKENSTLTFFEKKDLLEDMPSIFFLAGENGSGKTSILNLIYFGLGKVKKGYAVPLDSKDLKVEFSLLSGDKYETINIYVEDGYIRSDVHPDNLKIIYNGVDVSFKKVKITSATATTADEKDAPKEESENLSEEIPQLLVNIKTEDDSFFADYYKENGKAPENYIRKLDRFTKAFEKMFNGTKTFRALKREDGEIKIIFTDKSGNEVDLNTFSTGEKQIIFRVGHLLKDLKNLDNALILIDEPETSLHPKWQKKYAQYLMDVFGELNIQFVIATHSPYILQGLKDKKSVCFKIDRGQSEIGQKVGFYKNMIGDGPSVNLINYKVYDIVDELLQIELFAALEIKEGGYAKLKNKMNSDKKIIKAKSFIATVNYNGCRIGDTIIEALPLSIRNKIHHADEKNRPEFDENNLRESTEIMLKMLSN